MIRSIEVLSRWWAKTPVLWRLAVLASVVFLIWIALLGDLIENTPILGYVRGGTADWMVVREAWMVGGEPFASTAELAESQLGWVGSKPTTPHPRPPSALFLLGPLAVVPSAAIIWVLMGTSALCLTAWVHCSAKWVGTSPTSELLVIPLAAIPATFQGVIWGSHIMIVAAFMGSALLAGLSPRRRAVTVALASALKLFPFLLALAVKRDRVTTVLWASGALLMLTTAGALLPGVELTEAVAALTAAPAVYGARQFDLSINGVLAWPPGSLLLPLCGIALVIAASHLLPERSAIGLALIMMVLFSPLAWPEYTVLWLPVLLMLWTTGILGKLVAVGLAALTALTIQGAVLTFVGVALMVFVILLVREDVPHPTQSGQLVYATSKW